MIASERAQFRPLVRTFVSRFFENDLTDTAHDLKRSFFGLVAVLGVPGALGPFMMSFTWTIIGRTQGFDALRVLSRADKDLYLGFTLVGTLAVCALTWSALSIDRRDALVLGALPIRARTIVTAKLAALGIYVGAIGLAMHAPSAVVWGICLDFGHGSSLGHLVRGITAHFVSGCAATATAIAFVAAIQGLVLLTAGPRRFAGLTPVFQTMLVVLVGVAAIVLPAQSVGIVGALQHPLDATSVITLRLPPAWFVGLYERILGGSLGTTPEVAHLSTMALEALAATMVVALMSNALAYLRVLRAAVESDAQTNRGPSAMAAALGRAVASTPSLRAAVVFYLTSISRVERLRLVLAAALGLAVVYSVPVFQSGDLLASGTRHAATVMWPISLMVLWLAGLRVAAALPADLKAAWIFDLHPSAPESVRATFEWVLLVVGVVPFVFLDGVIAFWKVAPSLAWRETALAAAIGWMLTEMLIFDLRAVPGTVPWRPERANLRSRWPIYLSGFLWLGSGLQLPVRGGPSVILGALHSLPGTLVLVGVVVAAAAWIRSRGLTAIRIDPTGEFELTEATAVTVRLSQ
jgi:hypothetical protein